MPRDRGIVFLGTWDNNVMPTANHRGAVGIV